MDENDDFSIDDFQNYSMNENMDYLDSVVDNVIRDQHERILDIVFEIPRIERMPMHTSVLTGMNWVRELINGHPDRIHNNLRMTAPVFLRFCSVLKNNYGLCDTRKFSHIEAVAIFLFIIATGNGFRQVSERFQHSLSTITDKFHDVLESCVRFTVDEIRHNDNANVHPHIQNSNLYYPHFKDCIGGIDGSHVRVSLNQKKILPFIGRKGNGTQNVLGVCDFNMCFTFVSTGWEGSMHDARILGNILRNARGYNFPTPPEGKYYLVDSGYPNMKGYLAPYKGDRYHLPDFRNGNSPRNANEMFNRSHASLRSVIERSFGVWKRRFHILETMPYFKIEDQVKVTAVTMAIHNFIRRSHTSNECFLEEAARNDRNNSEANGAESSTQMDDEPYTQMRADPYMDYVRDGIRHSICGIGE